MTIQEWQHVLHTGNHVSKLISLERGGGRRGIAEVIVLEYHQKKRYQFLVAS